jgi:hypothetical protein
MYRLWKDNVSDMVWGHFSWDEVELVNTEVHMKRVKTGITGKSDPAIIPLVTTMATNAATKPEFDDCPVTPAELSALVAGGTAALQLEVSRRELLAETVTLRHDKFKEIRKAVSQFADFARSYYEGDKALLQAVGLDVAEPQPNLNPLAAPFKLRAVAGEVEGTMRLSWPNVIGRDFFKLEQAQSGSGPWTVVYEGALCRTTIEGLTSGAEYFWRVRAHNSSGPGAWSDLAKKRPN